MNKSVLCESGTLDRDRKTEKARATKPKNNILKQTRKHLWDLYLHKTFKGEKQEDNIFKKFVNLTKERLVTKMSQKK